MIERYSLISIAAVDCTVPLEFAREQFLAMVARTPVDACRLGHFQFLVARRGQTVLLDIAVA